MSLRAKLLLAQAPLALALVAVTTLAIVSGELHARAEGITLGVAGLALLLGFVASLRLTTRLLRPLGVLGQAARRFGGGDLQARARVPGQDELARLAGEFNAMAEQLEALRHSQLGDLVRAREATRTALDALPEPVLVLNAAGALVDQNAAGRALLRPEAGALPAALAPFVAQALETRSAVAPTSPDQALRLPGADGERQWLPRVVPVLGARGELLGVTLSLQDVTRLKLFDELQSDVVATVAHEFKTPLTSLRMALHLLFEGVAGPLQEKQADLVAGGRQDCERLQALVDEVLDVSRLQSGRFQLERQPVDVRALVEAVLQSHRSAAQARRVRLEAEVLPSVEGLNADPDRLQVALANLVANAIRHTSEDSRVTLGCRSTPGAVRFEVSDCGPGIPEEFQGRVFERFFRVPGGGSRGSGLGLWIVREIAQAHGGQVGVSSAPGEGSRFWLSLPSA